MISSTLFAQNLVPNPSFELYTSCPTSAGAFAGVNNWYVVPTHGGSPDYHHVCGSSTFGVPVNIFGNQAARTGSAYIGFVTHFGSGNFREYLEVQLPTPMIAGTSYDVSAFLTLSDGSGWGTDGFGFYFSTTQVAGTGTSAPLPLTPQVANPNFNYISDKINWMPVTGNFTATANYNYLVIGNFKNDAATNYQVQSGWSWNYTYLDDISVVPSLIFSAEVLAFDGKVMQNQAILEWETSAENGTLGFELQRSIGDASNFETIATIAATGSQEKSAKYGFSDLGFDPNSLNYYRLREIDANGGGGYSQTIVLKSEEFVPETKVTLYPNPIALGNDASLFIDAGFDQEVNWKVSDMQGRLIQNGRFDCAQGQQQVSLELNSLATGTYLLQMVGEKFRDQMVFVVQ